MVVAGAVVVAGASSTVRGASTGGGGGVSDVVAAPDGCGYDGLVDVVRDVDADVVAVVAPGRSTGAGASPECCDVMTTATINATIATIPPSPASVTAAGRSCHGADSAASSW